MKTNAFKSLIKEKDINDDTQVEEIVSKINEEVNSIVAEKEAKLSEKSKKALEEAMSFKAKYEEISKTKEQESKELESLRQELETAKKTLDQFSDKYSVVKTVGNTLDDEELEDAIDLINKRVSKGKTKEEAIKEVAEKYLTKSKKESVKSASPSANSNGLNSKPDPMNERKAFIDSLVPWSKK